MHSDKKLVTKRLLVLLSIFIVSLQFSILPALSETNSLEAHATFENQTARRLEELSTQIGKKENELLRLNTNFRTECTKVSKWKPWRLFVYNLGASGCSNAGITSISATRWHYWTHPKDMPRSTAAAGPILLLIGHCITLGGAVAESTLDVVNDYKVRKKGLDIKTTHKKVLELKLDLDKLLAERETILANAQDLTPQQKELARAEGLVLKDVRDLSLAEYAQFYVRANKYFASRDANALMAIASASTGGFQGSLLGIISAFQRRPRLVGPGGLGFVISGATIVATPPTAKLAATIKGRFARKQMIAELDNLTTKSVAQLDADRLKLEQLLASTSMTDRAALANMERRSAAYGKHSALFTAQNQINVKEKALANKEFLERMLFATSIGGTKMSWGINLANAGFLYRPKYYFKGSTSKVTTIVAGKSVTKVVGKLSLASNPQPAMDFTRRVAVGATTYIPGTGLWIFDTLQNRVRGIRRSRALATQGQLPTALLQERFDRVQEIDDVFNY
jgi:hypothetical protein